jgi:hypothetical protein
MSRQDPTPAVDPLHRWIRWMTHLNIGAALGMVAWVAWSGWQVMTGQIGNPPQRPPSAALLSAHAPHRAHGPNTPAGQPLHLLTAQEAADAHAHCHPPAKPEAWAAKQAPVKEADL